MSAVQVREVESGSLVQSSRTQWTWASPDAPLRINLSLQMISRLRADLERSVDQDSSENELGGVLLGRANRTPATLEILDYAILPPTADSAGNYCLDVAQLERLRRKRGELHVVGYFRTQPDGALHLRRPEVGLISDHFRGATDVVLLIRTIPPFRAGFLFWDGEAFVQFSVHDFPFDATALVQESPEPKKAAAIKIDGMRDDPTVFPPIAEPIAPLRAPVEATVAPRKTVPVHRNMVAAGIAAAGIIGLSLLFWNDPPWASRPRPKPASQVVAAKVQDPVPPPAPAVQAKGAPQNKKDVRPPVPPVAKPAAVPPRGVAPLTAATALKPPAPVARAVPPPAAPTAPPLTPQPASSTPISAPAASSPVVSTPAAEPAPPPPSTPASAVSTTPASAVKEPPANPPAVAPALNLPTPPAPKEVPALKKEDAAATPAPPAPVVRPPTPSRYAGGWSYPLNNGLFHGSQPEIVEVTIQESNGRLSGSAYARFKIPNERPRSMRFQFSGPVRAGRTQAFNMETADGLKGTIELIPGPNPNLLELNFQTNPENGNGDSGNMILIKK